MEDTALDRCWRHSLATAVVSSEIADWAHQDSGDAYTAGILHDIGRLGLIAVDPSKYLQLIDKALKQGGALCDHEREVYGLDHSVADEWLAASWGLPASTCNAIRDHQLPRTSPDDEIARIVNYACRIADILSFSVLENRGGGDEPITEFLATLPAARRDRLNISIPEFQTLIASRVNALESP